MKNKKLFNSLFVIAILTVCVSIASSCSQDKNTQIEKEISKHIDTHGAVMVYNMAVQDEYRLIGYIIKGEQKYERFGYALFKVSGRDSYELINVIDPDKTTKENLGATIYEFSQVKLGDTLIPQQLVIMNNNPQVSKIEMITENGEYEEQEITSNPSVTYFAEDTGLDYVLKAKYKFYDKDGNIIK